eukprot:680248-Pyramimonas_sp.AAC.1
MFEVAGEAKRIVSIKIADTTESKLYRFLQALRAWRAEDSFKLGAAIAAYPALAQRFPDGLHDARCEALCLHVQ